jgi:hypothetical protein
LILVAQALNGLGDHLVQLQPLLGFIHIMVELASVLGDGRWEDLAKRPLATSWV